MHRRSQGTPSIEKAILLDVCLGVSLGRLWFPFDPPSGPSLQGESPRTCLLRGDQLYLLRSLYLQGHPEVATAIDSLKKAADAALSAAPYTVTAKAKSGPSGNAHDYVSLAKYWWPNPESENGLPYLRRDGEVNPECYSEDYDYVRLTRFSDNVVLLALATYLTGEPAYLVQASKLLQTWFIDPETFQTPHFEYAQQVPGRSSLRWQGIIESRTLIYIAESTLLLESTDGFDKRISAGIREWYAQFLRWLRESEHGRRAAQARNNIAFWYDLQCLVYAEFCGQHELARAIAREAVVPRISQQVGIDGGLPQEVARTRPYDYVAFTLIAMAALSRAADQEGIHLWDLEDGDGRSFQEAHDWLLRAVKPARLGRSTARHDKELRQFRRENHQDPFDLLDFGIQLRGALHIAKLRGLEAEEARAALFTLQHEPTTGKEAAHKTTSALAQAANDARLERERLIERLREENDQLQDALRKEREARAELSKEQQEAQGAILVLTRQLETEREERNRLHGKLEVLQERHAILHDELKSTRGTEETLRQELDQLKDFEDELEKLTREITLLRNQILDKPEREYSLQHQLDQEQRLRALHESNRVTERTHLIAQIDAAKAMWKHYQERSTAAEQRLQRQKREREVAIREKAKLEKSLHALKKKLEEGEDVRKSLRKRVESLEKDCTELKSYARQLERRLNALLSSRSWRLTAPCREIGRMVRFIGSRTAKGGTSPPERPKAFSRRHIP